MKFCTFSHPARGTMRPGVLTSDGAMIVDLGGAFPEMLSIIKGGEEAMARVRDLHAKAEIRVPLSDAELHAPVPVPEQIRDSMLFEKHVQQAMAQIARMRHPVLGPWLVKLGMVKVAPTWYQIPIYYKSNRFSVIGPDSDVIWPRYSQVMDFELEFGFFLGKKGKDIKPSEARDHIFGFTIFNDFSARDAQSIEMQSMLGPCKGKDFDTGNSMGPFLVTTDEIGDPYRLRMQARVNGETWCDSSSSTIHHKFEDLLARVSADETVHPGEFFGSGTVGDGCGLEHGRYLKDGDVVELEVEKIGVLRNRVVRQK
ncbi:fumarylacetoacetate hydrolase family protein [Sorangium sp. So ce834]|uniref:fumarylacetoacetate hydrolase family protein n=1 Tax=Sorangium sp. So ce834 TaxID=3133321 RepID=UPI003F627199